MKCDIDMGGFRQRSREEMGINLVGIHMNTNEMLKNKSKLVYEK